MSRNVSFVLVLVTGVMLADYKAEAGQAAGAAAQAKTEAAQGQTDAAPEKTKAAEGQTGEAQAQTEEGAKLTSTPGGKALGMSILGNQEAPTSLVIVPWKSSELGSTLGVTPLLDDSRQPVDKDVFMRALRYYEIRSGTTGHNDTAAGSDAAQSTATRRR